MAMLDCGLPPWSLTISQIEHCVPYTAPILRALPTLQRCLVSRQATTYILAASLRQPIEPLPEIILPERVSAAAWGSISSTELRLPQLCSPSTRQFVRKIDP